MAGEVKGEDPVADSKGLQLGVPERAVGQAAVDKDKGRLPGSGG
jgi:hypothetical protein